MLLLSVSGRMPILRKSWKPTSRRGGQASRKLRVSGCSRADLPRIKKPMSIQPLSDIVLDVANAADPTKALAASERLARFASAPDSAWFASALGAAAKPDSETAVRTRLSTMGAPTNGVTKPVDARTKAYKGLEALVLQNLVETMLPKDAGAYFGESAGSDMWRSLLSQRIGEQLAERMDLGIASKAAAIHGPNGAMPSARDSLIADVASAAAASGARI